MKKMESVEDDFKEAGHEPNLSVFGATFLFCATIMGAGIISIPKTFQQVGFVLGIILLAVFALATIYTIELLIISAEQVGARSYEELGVLAFGNYGKYLVAFPMMALIFGALMAFLAIIGDLLQPTFFCIYGDQSTTWTDRSLLLFMVVTFLILPLTLLKEISKLESLGFFAVLVIGAFCVSVIVEGASSGNLSNHIKNDKPFSFTTDFFVALPVIALAYTCQVNVFPIYHELKDASVLRMRQVSIGSGTLCAVIYIITGFFGYGSYGDDTKGDLFLNLPNSLAFKIIRILFCCALIIHYPIIHFSFRRSLEQILFPKSEFSWFRHTIETVILVYFTLFFEVLLPSVIEIFGLTGSIGSFLMCFILPTAVYIKIMPGKILSRSKLPALILLVISIALMIISIVVNLKSIIDYFRSDHPDDKTVC